MPEKPENWTEQQTLFMEWLALPKAERQPATQEDFAKESGIDPKTLYRWKRLPGFMPAVNRLARELVQDDIADVLGTIRRKAKKGDLAFVNMALAMAGMAGDVEDAGKGPGDPNGARERLIERLARLAQAAQPAADSGGDTGA